MVVAGGVGRDDHGHDGLVSAPDSPGPTVFVLFGATGDLAKRLVLPSFFRLVQEKLLPSEWRLIGSGRRSKTDDEVRDDVHAALEQFGGTKPQDGPWDEFAERLRFAGAASPPTTRASCSTASPTRAARSARAPSSCTTWACRPPPSACTRGPSGPTASPR